MWPGLSLGALRALIRQTVWDLLHSDRSSLERLREQLARIERALTVFQAGAVFPSPPFPGSGQWIVQAAKGTVTAGQPLKKADGFPDQMSALDATLAGVSDFAGFAGNDAADGGQVTVFYAGPAALFTGLPDPAPGDSNEFFVFGPGPPGLYSAVPMGAWYRSVGIKLNGTTLLVTRGSVIAQKF